jgi:hypothetical protein
LVKNFHQDEQTNLTTHKSEWGGGGKNEVVGLASPIQEKIFT